MITVDFFLFFINANLQYSYPAVELIYEFCQAIMLIGGLLRVGLTRDAFLSVHKKDSFYIYIFFAISVARVSEFVGFKLMIYTEVCFN